MCKNIYFSDENKMKFIYQPEKWLFSSVKITYEYVVTLIQICHAFNLF